MTTRIGIFGYGNLGRGVELALRSAPDLSLSAIFTRRDPASLTPITKNVPVIPASDLPDHKDKIDVLILCGGSATDLPKQTPTCAGLFSVVDSFDTHASIPKHFEAVNTAAAAGKKTALISCGWDPGMFSLNRLYASAILPGGSTHTFWGRGVSQGHSDAIRRIPGVIDARQYTVPVAETLESARQGSAEHFTPRQMHRRECFVVAEEGADLEQIRETICTMPNYFADYDTTVTFISAEEMREKHSAMPHGGFVIHSGETGSAEASGIHRQTIEYRLNLESNPEFTSSVLVACARAVHRMNREGKFGAFTLFDVPPAYLSAEDGAALRAHLL